MPRTVLSPALASLLLGSAACSSSAPTPPPPSLACTAGAPLALAAGRDTVLDVTAQPCLTLPAPGPAGAEYLLVAHSAAAFATPTGVFTPFDWRSGTPAAAVSTIASRPAPEPAATLHAALREAEARLAASRAGRSAEALPALRAAAPPVVGESRAFSVCADRTCATFTSVTAVARVVGRRLVVWLDPTSPADGFTDTDLAALVALADDHLIPIDTTAFGRLPDVDGDGLVNLLLSPAVNRLSGNCTTGLIVGYFFGNDLLPGQPGSNGREMLFAIVPDPASATCRVTRQRALDALPVTTIHELQHMISFNEHVLQRGGGAELTWLNEGLSHFAEELGGRQVPEAPGAPPGTRLTQFALANFDNGYGYLSDPGGFFLVTPTTSAGSLGERGANWLFVRWLADHFAGGVPDGTPLTRALVQTSRVGLDNVESATGTAMRSLVPQWLLANALEGDSTFAPANVRLGYRAWNLQRTYGALRGQDPGRFPRAYPLVPDSTTGAYARTGTLRGGSGVYLRVRQTASGAPLTFRLGESATAPLRPTFAAAVTVLRLR